MGCRVHTKSVQNLNIEGKPEYDTLELQNYTYMVLDPNPQSIPLKNSLWAHKELQERLISYVSYDNRREFRDGLNPGEAWRLREETWGPLRNGLGEFDYTYSQRYGDGNLWRIVNLLKNDLLTRRAFMPVFSLVDDMQNLLNTRIPCTLGYWFNYRGERLNITYLLRSSDFGEHFNYDIWLTTKLLEFVSAQVGVQPGTFTHWIGSFHVFEKDVADAF